MGPGPGEGFHAPDRMPMSFYFPPHRMYSGRHADLPPGGNSPTQRRSKKTRPRGVILYSTMGGRQRSVPTSNRNRYNYRTADKKRYKKYPLVAKSKKVKNHKSACGEKCASCSSDFESDEYIVIMKCGHFIHQKCENVENLTSCQQCM